MAGFPKIKNVKHQAVIPDSFKLENRGRSGAIIYEEEGKLAEIFWEMSGSPAMDIILAPIDLREWKKPKGQKIPQNCQLEILKKLRGWLKAQGIKSDIDFSLSIGKESKTCLWKGCSGKQISGTAYCQEHIDLNLLMK